MFKLLNEKEIKIIKMRYGLGDYENRPMSTYEIAKELTLSQKRVVSIEKKALMKIRTLCQRDEKSNSLKDYIR